MLSHHLKRTAPRLGRYSRDARRQFTPLACLNSDANGPGRRRPRSSTNSNNGYRKWAYGVVGFGTLSWAFAQVCILMSRDGWQDLLVGQFSGGNYSIGFQTLVSAGTDVDKVDSNSDDKAQGESTSKRTKLSDFNVL